MSKQPHETAVHDAGDLRKYRTEIPNIVYTLGLTPFEVTLYGYLKRVAGANPGGRCFQATATLARETGMSEGAVSNAKRGLERRDRKGLHGKPLIRIEKDGSGPGRARDVITIVDIWRENFHHFSRMEPDEEGQNEGQNDPEQSSHSELQSSPQSSHSELQSSPQSSHSELQSSPQSSPGECKNKKESSKKEPSEEGTEEPTPQPPAPRATNAPQGVPAGGMDGWGDGSSEELRFLETDRTQAEALLRKFGQEEVRWQVRALLWRQAQGAAIPHPWGYLVKTLRDRSKLPQAVALQREDARTLATPGALPRTAPVTDPRPAPASPPDPPPWKAAYYALPPPERKRLLTHSATLVGHNPVTVAEHAKEAFRQRWEAEYGAAGAQSP